MKSTGNAFTGATNSIKWNDYGQKSIGGKAAAAKSSWSLNVPNSPQQQAYSAAGYPKTRCEHLGICQSKKCGDCFAWYENPTHWMPLPQPPKDTK